MPTKPITMRKLKEILRLKYAGKLSHRQIAKSLSVSPSVISTYTNRAAQLGITSWPLDEKWTDSELNSQFLATRVKPKRFPLPDWSDVKKELKNDLVTLQTVWEEYAQCYPDKHYSYNHYCRLYRAWLALQKPSMRQTHLAGDKLFIDYCGPTVDVVDRLTGECRPAQVFVATLGASNFTYAEATWTQTLEDWCMSHVRCFNYLGGVPRLLVPDNLKSAVHKPHRYEPDTNPTYQQLAAHYNVAIMPARPYKPKDKAKAENAVLIVERWIMAKMRHETFFSLRELNNRILELLYQLNSKVMRTYKASRSELFAQVDKGALQALPLQAYQFTRIKKVRVHMDYHIEFDKHYYSVPHTLLKQTLEVHVSDELVTIYHQGQSVAIHPRSRRAGGHTTEFIHMPKSHQQMQWSPQRIENWAKKIGINTYHFVRQVMAKKRHPEHGYRTCIGTLSLSKYVEPSRLEAACERALLLGQLRMKCVKDILDNHTDKLPLPTSSKDDQLRKITHANIRGNTYYQ